MSEQPQETDWLSVRNLGVALAVIALVVTIVGTLQQHNGIFDVGQLFLDLWANTAMELASIAITVLIIDNLIQRRETQREKERLIRHMGSTNNATALQAVEDLRVLGWLEDGSLHSVNLAGANLEGANLKGADLQNAHLYQTNLQGAVLEGTNLSWTDLCEAQMQGANLRAAKLMHTKLVGAKIRGANLAGAIVERATLRRADLRETNLSLGSFQDVDLSIADLREADLFNAQLQGANLNEANLEEAIVTDHQLAQASMLLFATMPNGKRYDGRFDLINDQLLAEANGVERENPTSLALWYGTVPEDGQADRRDASTNIVQAS